MLKDKIKRAIQKIKSKLSVEKIVGPYAPLVPVSELESSNNVIIEPDIVESPEEDVIVITPGEDQLDTIPENDDTVVPAPAVDEVIPDSIVPEPSEVMSDTEVIEVSPEEPIHNIEDTVPAPCPNCPSKEEYEYDVATQEPEQVQHNEEHNEEHPKKIEVDLDIF